MSQHHLETRIYQLYESERQARERAEVLREFARIVSSSLDRQEILRQSLNHLRRILVFDSASIYLRPRSGQVEFVAGIGFDDEEMTTQAAEELLEESPLLQEMAQTLAPIISPDVRALKGWIWIPGAEHVRSFMGVPLVVHDSMIGALMLDSRQPDRYQESDLEIVEPLAQQIAISIENAWLFETAQRRLRVSQTLQQVGALLTTSLSLAEVYEQIFDLLAQVVEYDSVSIQLANEDSQELYLAASRGFTDLDATQQFLTSVKRASLKKFAKTQRWRVISDTHADPGWIPAPSSVDPIRSCIGAILMIKGRLVGVLNVDSRIPGAYDDALGETVAAFANQAAVAIENARLHSETRQRANELEILRQVAVSTAALTDVDALLRQTTELIANSLYPDVFGLLLIDEETGALRPHSSYRGLSPEVCGPIPPDKSVVGAAVQTGRVQMVADVALAPRYYNAVSSTRSEIAVPIMIKGKILGVINVESPRLNAFSDNDARFLVTLAGQVAVALERAQLYEALQRHADELSIEVAARTAELETERDRNLAILESAGEGIFLTDVDAKILYVNQAMERQSGYARDELLGQDPRILQSGQTPKATYRDMWHTILQGKRWTAELVNRRKDGTLYDVSLTIMPVVDTAGEITSFVSVQSDISRLKEVERLKSKFVSNVSHELRTPLTNIKTYLTLLERGRQERHAHYLNVLNLETERLTRLIQDLLDLSRLETEPILEEFVPSNIHEVLRARFEAFRAGAEARQICFELEVEADLPFVMVEKHHLGQLLTNLIGNALAYTPEGGRVIVRAGRRNASLKHAVWVQVADTGPGISGEDRSRLFERFFRGQAATVSSMPGTGLGLAICKEILDRYGGRIDVESELGAGSQFTVWLPVVA